jgi:hypothetical protein
MEDGAFGRVAVLKHSDQLMVAGGQRAGTDAQVSFEREWDSIRHRLLSYCNRIGRDSDRGDEIFQRTSIRVWLGFRGFRRETPFLVWACKIAHNEADRLFAKEIALGRKKAPVAVEDLTNLPSLPGAASRRDRLSTILATAAQDAVTTGHINETESRVILGKLERPDASWIEIGAPLSLTANACAAAHCRAMPKLGVYLFVRHADALGGKAAIKAAYEDAVADSADPLTRSEQTAFLHIILNGSARYRRRGWRETLRSACRKVGRKLRMEDG